MRPGFCSKRVVAFERAGAGGGFPETHSGMIKSAERA
jgi:hypothetical protein